MSIHDYYAQFVERLFAKRNQGVEGLIHASIGVAVKKYWVYDKPLDRTNVIEELGDIEFYCAAMRSLIGVTREEVIAANIDKLRKRYPGETYTDVAAIVRADKN